ncbi:MAG: lamin tail domain-containing protein, partial [Bacteroidota bacterium]
GTLIPAQDYLLVASDTLKFRLYHPQVSNLLGPLDFNLSGKGETISLLADDCCVLDVVPMDNQSPWPETPDGEGFSLSLLNDSLNNYLPQNWSASANFGGTPGAPNLADCDLGPAETSILINEVNYRSHPAADAGDWIELHNPSLSPVDLSGWEIHDGDAYYQFPASIMIPPDGYMVVAQDLFRFGVIFPYAINGLGGWNFGFSGDGERIVLLNQNRCLIDELRYNDSPPWPVEADGQGPTLALMSPDLDNSLAGSWAPSIWGGALTGTPGMANQIPDPCGSNPAAILISEISYRSNSAADAGNWLELYNPTAQTVDLSGWLLLDEDSVYTFPAGASISANGYLVVAEDLSAFQAQFPAFSSGIIGSSQLNFNNGGERLLLYSDSRCLIDSLGYDNQFPWPEALPGDQTMTIALLDLTLDNSLGQNWGISSTSPGAPNQVDCLPWLSVSPPALWYKANQMLGNGMSVPQWDDQSGNNRHAIALDANTQASYSSDTINHNDWLNFDGQNQYYHLANASSLLNDSCTIIALQANAAGQGGSVLSSSEGGFAIGYDEEGYLVYPDQQKINAKAWDTAPIITSYQYIPAQSIKTRVNGELVGSLKLKDPLETADSVFLGRSQGQAADTIIWFEAECGQRGSKFQALTDASTSNGGYLEIQPGNNDYNSPGDTSKQVDYHFRLSKAGNYRVYGLVRAPNGNDDSFWVRIDNGSWAKWNSIERSSSYVWDQVHDQLNGNQAVVWALSAGEHTLSVASREDGTRLDKLVISNQNAIPSGLGGTAYNCQASGLEQYWEGSLAELLIFPKVLSDQEIAGVESYLSLKYGISVANPQLLDAPWSLNQGGIGKDDRMCLAQLSSQNIDSTSLLRISAENPLDQGAYLLWSTNGASVDTSQAKLDVPAGISKRLARTWSLQAYQLNSSVKLSFDLNASNGPINELAAWQLLVATDSNFSDAQIWTGDSMHLSEGILEVYGLDFGQDVYISLGIQEYVQISAKAILSGAWEASDALMRDDLRQGDWLPLLDPYIGERSVADHVLAVVGPRAVVDWVMLELRSSSDSAQVLWQEPLLVARDGSLLNLYGDTTLYLPIKAGYYFVSLGHRNHLGVMTASASYLSQSNTHIDFRSEATHGTHAQKTLPTGEFGLWAGDSNGDGQLIFQGVGNDPTEIFLGVLSAPGNNTFARNYVISGYLNADVNLDGQLIFQGGSTDVSPIFINILTYPLNT